MIHSGEVETSLILAYDESLVDPSYTNLSGNSGGCSDYEDCGALSTFHYMESHTENGIMGESCAASKEKGIALADAYCKRLVEVLSDEKMCIRDSMKKSTEKISGKSKENKREQMFL